MCYCHQNFHSGNDQDLLLIQQARKLKEDIGQLRSDLALLKSQPQSNVLNRYRDEIKKHFISKYEKLYKKQYDCQNVKKRKRSQRPKIKKINSDCIHEKLEIKKQLLVRAESMIINKSKIDLTENDRILLMHGLNFVPTPNWTDHLANVEWFNAMKHLWRVEWRNVLGEHNTDEMEKLPKKLMLPSFSRPSPEQLDDEVKAYSEMILTRMRNLKPLVKHMFTSRNNSHNEGRTRLTKLMRKVRKRDIVICKADNDGEILIIDYSNYDQIMNNQLCLQFTQLTLNEATIKQHLATTLNQGKNWMIRLYDLNAISAQMLFNTIGVNTKTVPTNKRKSITQSFSVNIMQHTHILYLRPTNLHQKNL